ncbi:DUF5597 domain-containing protein [Paenibacillus tundrae]|uniref:GH35 family beta-galactosidase n=1 Tax=Paenibacillus tundrae TaxID=528187 RepID=UPI0030CB2858
MTLPYLKKEDGVFNLYVDNKPYIALAGEIHNSSASDLDYMRDNVWPNLRGLHLNTVIAPVYWELVEPNPGEFDFELVEGIIEQAREENVRLVLLWFGLWKNGVSSYVPAWVKRNKETYFRTAYRNQTTSDTISPLCEEAIKADANAFRQFMSHLKKVDSDHHTVIMVQMENEIGFLGSDRDYSDAANERFNLLIPDEVGAIFGKEGTWKEAFGYDAEEYFMAYHYAQAVELIASNGIEEYPLPVFVNAWLEQFPWNPGSYPSGGPIAKVIPIWKATAPSICLYAPDIYVENFTEVCEEYTSGNENPLFIPEARRDVASVAKVFYAFGKYNALCYSPFGIEDFLAPPKEDSDYDPSVLISLNIDFSAFDATGTGSYLAQSYKLLSNMLGVIQKNRGTGKMTGFFQNNEPGCILSFSKYNLKVTYKLKKDGKPLSGGLVIEANDNEFFVVGIGFSVEFLPKEGDYNSEYVRIEEGTFVQDEWVRGRVLNGDEAAYGFSIGSRPSALRVELH